MKKNKKILKKMIAGMGGIAAVVTPVITVSACSLESFDYKVSSKTEKAVKEAGYKIEDDKFLKIKNDKFNLENAKTFEHINKEIDDTVINSQYMFTKKEGIPSKVIIITKGERVPKYKKDIKNISAELPIDSNKRFYGITKKDLDSAVALIFFQENVYQIFKVDVAGKVSEAAKNAFTQGDLPGK